MTNQEVMKAIDLMRSVADQHWRETTSAFEKGGLHSVLDDFDKPAMKLMRFCELASRGPTFCDGDVKLEDGSYAGGTYENPLLLWSPGQKSGPIMLSFAESIGVKVHRTESGMLAWGGIS